MNCQIAKAAEMAGAWWAERLFCEYAAYRPAFAAAVARRVAKELSGECYWNWSGERHEGRGYLDHAETEFDYDPHNCLEEALAEVMPHLPAYELRQCLPRKHTLDVYKTHLQPKEGYGNWTADIPVPRV